MTFLSALARNARRALAAAACVAGVLALAGPAAAQGSNARINLLVMSDDADTDTVPRNNRVFNRVHLALSEYLNTRGFQLYDETGVAMDITRPGRVRRTDAMLYEIARAVPTPIDAIVVYQIYASVRATANTGIRFPDIRIPGRVLNARTGQFIGSFEVGGFQLQALPVNCQAECMLENVGAQARILATDLGTAIAQKLEGFARPAGGGETAGKDGGTAVAAAPAGDGCNNLPTDYVIQLRDFTPSEITRIEGEFVRWGCYQQHRTTASTNNSADFFYRTSADSARITRNFRLMLELVGLNAQVNFTGNRVMVNKVLTR
jgi:hypothetical protein